MSNVYLDVPSPDDMNYHAEVQVRRTERALKQLDPGDVLAVIDARIAAEPDPQAHPFYAMVRWHLEKCLTPLDGAQFFDACRRLVIDAINVCLDEALSRGED
jgi:hypothetical protein